MEKVEQYSTYDGSIAESINYFLKSNKDMKVKLISLCQQNFDSGGNNITAVVVYEKK